MRHPSKFTITLLALIAVAACAPCYGAHLSKTATAESKSERREIELKQDRSTSNDWKSYQDLVDRKFSSPANEAAECGRLETAIKLRQKAVDAWEKFSDGSERNQLLADQLFALMKLQFQAKEEGAGHQTFSRLGEMCRSGLIDTKSMVFRLSTEGASFVNQGRGYLAEQFFRSSLQSANTTNAKFYYQFEIARTLREQNKMNEAKDIYVGAIEQATKEKLAKQITLARMALAELFKEEGNVRALQETRHLLDNAQCPLCGSKEEIVPIAYGLVLPTEKMRAASNVTVHYGGCCHEPFRWYCKNCMQSF